MSRWWRRTRSPVPAIPFSRLDFLVVDVETTGLDPRRDHVLELGWVPVTRGEVVLDGVRGTAGAPTGRGRRGGVGGPARDHRRRSRGRAGAGGRGARAARGSAGQGPGRPPRADRDRLPRPRLPRRAGRPGPAARRGHDDPATPTARRVGTANRHRARCASTRPGAASGSPGTPPTVRPPTPLPPPSSCSRRSPSSAADWGASPPWRTCRRSGEQEPEPLRQGGPGLIHHSVRHEGLEPPTR